MIAAVKGDGTPLILIHGFGVDHRIMLPLDGVLSEGPWRRIYVDLPWARGATDTGERTPRAVADSVLHELRDHIGDEPFAVIGNSFGAMVARHLAYSLPSQCLGLATLAGVFQMDRSLRTVPQRQVVVENDEALDRAGEARDEFAEMAVVQSAENAEAFVHSVLPGLREAKQDVLDRLSDTYGDAYAPEDSIGGPFLSPALHVFGRQDHIVGFEDGLAMRRHYPRGSFVVLDTAGHNVHLEQPDVVRALLREWLSRVRAQASLG